MAEPKGLELFYARGVALVKASDNGWGIDLRFEHIRDERRTAEVGAEVTVYAGRNGSTDLLHRTRLNLSSARARMETAKYLTSRLAGLDWPGMLEASSWKVIDAYREGRPAFLLRDAKPPPGGRVLLSPLLLAKETVILFGDGGGWKSYLALALGLSVHSGRPLVGGLKPTARLRVALLDWEWNESPHQERMVRLWGPEEQPDLVYIPCQSEGPLSHQVDRVRGTFQKHQIEYAVLDSVGLACDGPPEDAEVCLRFFQALGRLEVGSLLLAHVNKGGDTENPFGSIFWRNSARATWFVKKAQEEGDAFLDLALFNRKVNDGARHKPVGLHVEFTPDRTLITLAQLTAVPELAAGLSLKDRIAAEVRGGALTCKELAERLGKPENEVRAIVGRHANKTFVKVGSDPYRVGLVHP